VILRPFSATGDDARTLTNFACSTGPICEDEVEDWVRHRALGWLNDIPKAAFQRRHLALVESDESVVAVAAWQDIVRVDLEGIWLEVLAVAATSQHDGRGQAAYDLVVEKLRRVDRDGDEVVGVVHLDNERSQRLLTRNGWRSISAWDADHELWAGRL